MNQYKEQIEKIAYSIEYGRDKSYPGKNTKHILLDDNKNEIGYAISRPMKNSDDYAFSELHINPKYQGNGYSNILIKDVINRYPENNIILRVNPYKNKRLSKEQLESLYKKNGFNNMDDGRMIYKNQIEKTAASYDARRKKQYWQMLKRLYGGTDRAINNLSKTRDFNIYHGTNPFAVDKIMKDKLKPGRKNIFGKGVYFGDKPLANDYAMGFGIKSNAIRFKRPSELKGSKELYPDINKVFKESVDLDANKNIKPDNLNVYGLSSYPDNKYNHHLHINDDVDPKVLKKSRIINKAFYLPATGIPLGLTVNHFYQKYRNKKQKG